MSVVGIGFVQAWERWFHGEQLQGYALGGVSILWWGRAGKLLEFVAGLTVVLDLIGADRLRQAGRRAGDRSTRAWRYVGTVWRWNRGAASRTGQIVSDLSQGMKYEPGVGLVPDPSRPRATSNLSEKEQAAGCGLLVLCYLITAGVTGALWLAGRTGWGVIAMLALGYSSLFGGPVMLLTTVGAALVTVVVAPFRGSMHLMARVLHAAKPDHILRTVAVVIFIVGFPFDLLSS